MARLQCQTCGGEYDDVLPDKLRYFHACPPLSVSELQAAVDDGRVVLATDETVAQAHGRRIYERAGKRDENVKPTAVDGKVVGLVKAEGRGAVAMAPVAAPRAVVVPDGL
jgi:hypothetical protein